MFMDSSAEFEGSAQESALQRLWARRLTLTGVLEESAELTLLEDLFPSAQDSDSGPDKNFSSTNLPSPQHVDHHPDDSWNQVTQQKVCALPVVPRERYIKLDAGLIGDIPACYVIPALEDHEYPVVGVWMDPRVVPGFRYRVRTIQDQPTKSSRRNSDLFNGRALILQNIGRGYSRRLTFQADNNSLNDNVNYFWSDSNPEGFAFELEVVSVGDKFTLHDANHVSAGTLEIVCIQGPQQEIRQVVLPDGSIEKRVRVQALAKVEWFQDGQTAVLPMSGLAVAVKPRSGQSAASVTRVLNVAVGSHQRRGFTLTPGVHDTWRHTVVQGQAIGDVPTCYTISGLEAHELPVIGTYVDPRIMPGFQYKVRPSGSKRPLFSGRSLRLTNIGPGYGKRLTFAANENQLNTADNYLWSDTHPEGLGFEPRAVHAGMMFSVTAAGQRLGEASVFRADAAQQEEKQELIKEATKGTTIIKHIHVDVTCHVTLSSTNQKREPEAHLMRVSGSAVVVRQAGTFGAQLVRIENIGLDSQLNLLFVTQQAELVFYPM